LMTPKCSAFMDVVQVCVMAILIFSFLFAQKKWIIHCALLFLLLK
jgi:hypothetical protein